MTGFLKLFLVRALNVQPTEIFDVFVSWCLGLVLRIGFVIGWTILLVDFIEHFGVSVLPFLFLIYALATIAGYLIYKKIIASYKPHMVLLVTCTLGAMAALASFYLHSVNYYFYLTALFTTIAIFLNQARVCKMMFVESLFSPTQSSRVFPVIESADTFGLIFGGFIVSMMSSVFEVYMLPLFIALSFLLAVPLIANFTQKSIKHPLTILMHKKSHGFDSIKFKHLLSSNLLLSISAIVFLQFIFFGILELQYVEAVFEFSHGHHGAEGSQFAFDLGILHVIFGLITMAFQLFVASRMIEFTGIIKSMLISPLVLLSSILFVLFSPGFVPIVLTKFNFELSGVLFNNSYHSSYYVFSHSSRAKIMEFLETLVRPLSLIVVSLVIILFQHLGVATVFFNVIGVISLCLMLYTIKLFEKSYIFIPRMHIKSSNDRQTILNALSILKQNPKDNNAYFLLDVLSQRKFEDDIYPAIFDVISDQGDLGTLNLLLNLIKSSQIDAKCILPCINKLFVKFADEIKGLSFTRYFIHEVFESIPKDSSDPLLKAESLSFLILSNLSQTFTKDDINHIRRNLNDDNIDFIFPLLDQIKDPNICLVLKPLINPNSPRLSYFIARLCHKFQVGVDFKKFESLFFKRPESHKYLLLMAGLYNYNLECKDLDVDPVFYEFVHKVSNKANCFAEMLYSELDKNLLIEIKSLSMNIAESKLEKLINNRLEIEIHKLFASFDIEHIECQKNKAVFAELSDIYNVLGSSKEYFVVRDLLSQS